MTNACQCGQPAPDAFLCTDCVGDVQVALTKLGQFIPELGVAVTRQDRTTSGSPIARPTTPDPASTFVPPQLRTTGPPVSLVRTADPVGYHASDILDVARNEILGWARHLCETRGLSLTEELAKEEAA